MPELSDGEDDDFGDDEEQWQWMEEDKQQVSCLFCDRWGDAALQETANIFNLTFLWVAGKCSS